MFERGLCALAGPGNLSRSRMYSCNLCQDFELPERILEYHEQRLQEGPL
jgi:hypothetical protein